MKKEYIVRNKENLSQLYNEIARVGNGKLQVRENFSWVDCRPSSWPMTIFDLNVTEVDFSPVIDGIRRGIIPAFCIRLRNADLETANARFEWYGFKHLATWPGMCLPLKNLVSLKKTCQASIQRVNQEEEMGAWVALANETLFKTRPIELSLFKALYLGSDKIRFYTAKVEEKVVSIVMSFDNKKTVGIYAVSTLDAYRKQGISSALTHFALAEAKTYGCSLASLQATKMGERVYQNLGFKGYGNYDVYWLLGYQ